jgi:hypothetical protein
MMKRQKVQAGGVRKVFYLDSKASRRLQQVRIVYEAKVGLKASGSAIVRRALDVLYDHLKAGVPGDERGDIQHKTYNES